MCMVVMPSGVDGEPIAGVKAGVDAPLRPSRLPINPGSRFSGSRCGNYRRAHQELAPRNALYIRLAMIRALLHQLRARWTAPTDTEVVAQRQQVPFMCATISSSVDWG